MPSARVASSASDSNPRTRRSPLARAAACALVIASLATLGCSGAGGSLADRGSAGVDAPRAATVVPGPLVASPSFSRAVAGRRDRSELALRPIESFRRPLPEPPVRLPLDEESTRLLSRAAEAISRGAADAALASVAEVRRRAPFAPEAVEVEVLAQLSRGSPRDLRASVVALAELDGANPLVIAFEGLDAVQAGDDDAALAALAWFVGPDALPRRGVAVPLPTAAAELEEQAAFVAMRLGALRAALDGFDAAIEARAGDAAASRRIEILRADALVGLGREVEALDALGHVVADVPPGDPIAHLADLRRDHLRREAGDVDAVFAEAWSGFSRAPLDEAAWLRVLRAAPGASAEPRRKSVEEIDRGIDGLTAPRARIMRAALGSVGAERGIGVDLEDALLADPGDRAAVRAALRMFAEPRRCARVACELVVRAPNELDAVAAALLASGIEVDALLAALEAERRGSESDALRSRVHAGFGFPEEALAIAEAARMRDRASRSALAAAALAAAELGDEDLLVEIDAEATAAGGAIARVLAASWLAVGADARARERAETALAADPDDERAQLIAALASLGDRSRAEEAGATIRALVARGGRCAGDAWTRLADVEASERRRGIRPSERLAPIDAAPRLMAVARVLDDARVPLFFEAIALAEEIDPTLGAIAVLPTDARSLAANPSLAEWSRRVVADAPALPSRRRFAAIASGSEGAPANASALAARFDMLAVASAEERARAALLRAGLRPRTPSALANLARISIALGQHAEAAAYLDAACRGESAPRPRPARDLILAHGELATAAPAVAAARATAARACIARSAAALGRATFEDMLAAMRALLAAPADAAAIDALAATLANVAEPADASAFAAYGELFRALVAIEDDPFPASRLAQALARRAGLDPDLRGRLATAAIAMSAAAGDGADLAIEFIDAITAAGVRPFASSEDAAKPATTADILVRASGVFSMVGDQAGGETMLLEAIRRDPDHSGGLNNLAYARIVRGKIDDETVAMAERAAKAAPDDPGILDTLGLVRYHQGVLRDGAAGPGAISLYRQALRLRPDQPSLETLDHLGDALWRDGDQQGAIRCWQEVPRVAMLRFPPGPLARNLVEYQRREFGVELVEPEEYIRRQYGAAVERAERKLEEVARGAAPSVEDCRGLR